MRTITDADLAALKVIGEFAVSPDGTQVVFALGTTDYDANKTYSNLWLVPVTGGEPRPLTTARAKDSAPALVAGRHAHRLHERPGRGQTRRCGSSRRTAARPKPCTARTARPSMRMRTSPSRNGCQTARASCTYRKPRVQRTTTRPTPSATDSDVKVYTRLGYKLDGVGFWDGRYKHLFTVPATGGEPTQLTDGPWDDVQPVPSPDGTRIAFVSRRTPNREYNSISDIFTVPADGGEATQLTPGMGPVR